MLREIAAGSTISRPGGANDDYLFRAGDRAEGLFLIAPGEPGEASGPAVLVSFDDRTATAPKVIAGGESLVIYRTRWTRPGRLVY